MDVSEAIRKRRSIKQYLDIPVEWDKIGSVLDSGRLAPSAGNLQPWKFIVVLNPEGRKKISEACFQQYWMQTAPCHIIICAEINKMNRFYGVRGERLYSIQSCAAAAENMLLEAVNQGLAGSFVSAFDEEMIKRHFKIADFARPQIIITLGYPGEEIPPPPKYTLNDIVHVEMFMAKIKDFEGYLGYGWGRNIKNAVMKSKDVFDKIASRGEGAIKKVAGKMKINEPPEKKSDFRYRGGG